MSEKDLQEATADFVGWALRDDVVAFHVPNERETKSGRIRMAAAGVLPGVADWVILAERYVPGVEFSDGVGDTSGTIVGQAYCVELKVGRHKQTDAQRDFERRCEAIGVPYAVCRTLEEFEVTLREWGLVKDNVRLW